MPCESIRLVVRTFLDDLLDEKDYQNIQAHLAVCKRCHSYASSVGTLSYRLYELGQAALPPDMSSAILFAIEQKHHDAASPAAVSWIEEKIAEEAKPSRTNFFWLATLGSLVVAATIAVAAVSIHPIQKESVVPVNPTASPSSTETPKEAVPVSQEAAANEVADHWHYHVSRSSLGELKQIFRDLYLTVLDESSSHLVFYVPRERSKKFISRMAGLSGVVKEYGNIDASKVKTEVAQVSIYLD